MKKMTKKRKKAKIRRKTVVRGRAGKKIKKVTYKQALRKLQGKKKKRKKVVKKAKSRKMGSPRFVAKRKAKKSAKPRVYIGKDPLDQLFESQPKVKLLRFFLRNAENMFEQKDIFKRLRSNAAVVRREMKKLENIGTIKQKKALLTFETKRGKVKKIKKTVFYLNPGFEFINELKSLILKSAIASKDDLVKQAKKVGNVKLLVLAGIFMNDDGAAADLLLVGDRINQRKLNDFIKNLEAEVGKELNCAIMTSKEFDYRYDMYDRFVRDLLDGNSEILIQKINLW